MNRTQIKKPVLELEEILPALFPIVEDFANSSKKERIVKVYLKDEPTKNLSPFEKGINLLYYCLHSFVSKVSDKADLSLFRVKITEKETEIFYKEDETYKSFYFSIKDVVKQFEEIDNLTDSQKENFYIDRLITLLSKK